MRALVTGGAGFIGSHLVDALVASGDDVVVVDDLSSGRRENLAAAEAGGARLIRSSVADADGIGPEAEGFAPDVIFHLAAQVDVRAAVRAPARDAAINVLGTINVLEAARRGGSAVVFASTGGAIYGEGDGRELPFDESAAALPESAYGASKLAGEGYLALYARAHGLRAAALRLGNVYGPRQDPAGEAGVVAIFCGRLREGRPLLVFGDGGQTRDYVYVGDVVEALRACAGALGREGAALGGRPLNVGTGRETSVRELIGLLAPMAPSAPRVEQRPERAGEVKRVAIDPGAAAAELGWRPRVGLAEGLERTYRSLGG